MLVALLVLGALAFAAWQTMDPGKYRALVWVLLGFFAARVVLGKMKAEGEGRRRPGE